MSHLHAHTLYLYLGLLTDRKAFIELVEQENVKFKPFGRYVGEFERQVEIK